MIFSPIPTHTAGRNGMRRVIDGQAAFIHHFFEVAVTEGVAQLPAHAEKDDLGLIVTPRILPRPLAQFGYFQLHLF
jgi:hypothetical protein